MRFSATAEDRMAQPAKLPNTHARKGTSVAKPTGATSPRGSSLCRSVVPLIGLTTLQWALGAAMPSSTHSTLPASPGCWATRKRRRAGNGVSTYHEVKAGESRTGAEWKQQNRFRGGRLMRP
jgi:hypothetical protein